MTKPASETELSARFIQAWPAYAQAVTALGEAIAADFDRPCWAWRCASDGQAREACAEIVSQYLYTDEQDPREVVILPALVGSATEVLRLAHAANARRELVRDTLKAMDRRQVRLTNPLTGRIRRERLGDVVLRDQGLARLHRVQVYRDVHVLERRPDRVGFVWARTRRVQRLSVAQVRERVLKLLNNPPQEPFARQDLDRLRNLPDSTELALVEAQPCHARVNLAWQLPDGEGFERAMRPAAMPLLYPAEADEELPRLSPLDDDREARHPRAPRHDKHLEPEPFLSTLPVYRYLGATQPA